MADPRIDTVERFWQALNAQDDAGLLGCMTEDIVLDWSRSQAPYAGVMRGRSEAAGFVPTLLDPFGATAHEHSEPELISNERALVAARMIATGRGSGLEIEANGAFLLDFEGALLNRMTVFQSLPEARHYLRRERLANAHLYFVCEGRPGGEGPDGLLEAALAGGVDVIQLREKAPRRAEEMVALAEPFRRAAGKHDALFFINDDPELVEPCGADGVHLGQDDTPVAEARRVSGPAVLVGLSTHSPQQFDSACSAQGNSRPDQISVGPVWETPTKPGRPAAGLEVIKHAAASASDAAWFAIGGIDAGNIAEVTAAGARRAVVVRAIRDAADPETAARELRAVLERADG